MRGGVIELCPVKVWLPSLGGQRLRYSSPWYGAAEKSTTVPLEDWRLSPVSVARLRGVDRLLRFCPTPLHTYSADVSIC